MPLEIPVSQSAYSSITVDLDQETFRIDLRWNSREESWYMDIRQVDDTPIRLGVKVTPQASINLPYRTGGMPRGILQVLPERSTILRVGRYDFGTNAKLYYISSDEVTGISELLSEPPAPGVVEAARTPEIVAVLFDAANSKVVLTSSELMSPSTDTSGYAVTSNSVPCLIYGISISGNLITLSTSSLSWTDPLAVGFDSTVGTTVSTDNVRLASFTATGGATYVTPSVILDGFSIFLE